MRLQWQALGGWNSIYMATFFGFAGTAFGWQQPGLVAFTKPVMSPAGLQSVARTGLWVAGPTLIGLTIGIVSFGSFGELRNLMRNGGTYGREMKAIRRELYYE